MTHLRSKETPQYNRVKLQEEDIKFDSLDDYFCRGNGFLRSSFMGQVAYVKWSRIPWWTSGTMNYREGVREEKWGMLRPEERAVP